MTTLKKGTSYKLDCIAGKLRIRNTFVGEYRGVSDGRLRFLVERAGLGSEVFVKLSDIHLAYAEGGKDDPVIANGVFTHEPPVHAGSHGPIPAAPAKSAKGAKAPK